MRLLAVLGLTFSIFVLGAAASQSQEVKKPAEKKAAMTMDQCQEFCDIMSDPGLSPKEQETIQYCVRKNFCNFLKADAPPLGLLPTTTRQAQLFLWRLKHKLFASDSTQNAK